MLLTGWKEIAVQLRCGVRTVQRWEKLGLPVTRAGGRTSGRGLVVADSERLESWVHSRSVRLMRSDVVANLERARSLRDKLAIQLRLMLKTELEIGRTHVRIARTRTSLQTVSRDIRIARRAYDSIILLMQRTPWVHIQSKQFAAELRSLRAALRALGEKI